MATLVASALLCAGCREDPPTQALGLPAVHLYVSSADQSRMRNGVFTNTGVSVEAFVAGRWRTGLLTVAGVSTRDDLRKNYNLDLFDEPGFLGLTGGQRRIRLNAMSRDRTALRALLAFRAHGMLGLNTVQPEHVTVFVNDDYLGLYLQHEVINGRTVSAQGQDARAIYAARATRATMMSTAELRHGFDGKLGTETFADLQALVAAVLSSEKGVTPEIERRLNVGALARYMAAAAFLDNGDGIVNNFVLVRTREDPRFTIWPWDLDLTLRASRLGCTNSDFDRNAMMGRCFADPAFRERFERHLARLDSVESRAELSALLDTNAQRIERAHGADPYLSRHGVSFAEGVAALRATLASPRCPAR